MQFHQKCMVGMRKMVSMDEWQNQKRENTNSMIKINLKFFCRKSVSNRDRERERVTHKDWKRRQTFRAWWTWLVIVVKSDKKCVLTKRWTHKGGDFENDM